MSVLVKYPPRLNSLYLCAHAISVELLKPKLQQRVYGLMRGELEQKEVTAYYRREIVEQMQQRPTLDFDRLAEEQWEDANPFPGFTVPASIYQRTDHLLKKPLY
ncbi:hypothetical protein [Paenibacillus puerhi]|uniref:hypothetical protein n=1 Tax=Paenibacillus puerhi TaxID=2692622 RepID=UPI00135947B3|nr:hypothetical protein [Paenibacillus puerhi]